MLNNKLTSKEELKKWLSIIYDSLTRLYPFQAADSICFSIRHKLALGPLHLIHWLSKVIVLTLGRAHRPQNPLLACVSCLEFTLFVWKRLSLIWSLLWMPYFLFTSTDWVQHNMKHTLSENVKVSWHDGALKNANLKSCTADCPAGPMDTPFPDLQLVCQEISLN